MMLSRVRLLSETLHSRIIIPHADDSLASAGTFALEARL